MHYIIYQTAFTGDIILSVSMLHTIKTIDPQSKIIFITTPAGQSILRNDRRIDHLIVYDKRKKNKGLSGFLEIRKKILNITKGNSVFISPHRFLRASLLGILTKSKIRAGFKNSFLAVLYNRKTEYRFNVHEIERNFDLLKSVFVEKLHGLKPERPELILSDQDHENAKKAIGAVFVVNDPDLKMISIAPGSVWNTKKWPADYFKELIAKLLYEGMKILLIGGADETELCSSLVSAGVLNLAGRLTLPESAAAISMSRALVSNDSTPVHLASAMNTPCVAIFGPTVAEFGFTPLSDKKIIMEDKSVGCRPCGRHGSNECRGEHFECMRNIIPEMVFEAVRKIVD
jgi:heptosyltransferase II